MTEPLFNDLAKQIHAIVARYSRLAESIVKAQCRAIDKQPATITKADLTLLAANIGKAVGMFTTPRKGDEAAQAIRSLR